MASIRYWVWLSSQTNVSARARLLLTEHYGNAEKAFLAPEGEYAMIPGISAADAARLEKRDMGRVDAIIERCEEQGIEIIPISDARYPERLRCIADAPTALYVKGSLPDTDTLPAVAVIGTRRASPYGIKMGKRMAYEIAKCGGVVISLLTAGIDEHAARGALLAGGRCIAVLGTAHEACRSALYEDIISRGAVVSEYAPGSPQVKNFFRARNRIASGLSAGVVVVEAPRESGTLLFAEDAQEQGREIFAVPGNADSDNSAGIIELLQRGAKAVACGWDVMGELEPMFPGRISDAVSFPCPEDTPEIAADIKPKRQNSIDKHESTGYIDMKAQLAGLSEEQLKIVSAIDKDGSCIDDIIEMSGLGAAKVLAQLTLLEIKGVIKRAPGRRVILKTTVK